MPLTGPFAAMRALERNFSDLGNPAGRAQRDVARFVVREVRDVIVLQFAEGIAPDGSPHQARTDGRPALVSRRLGSTFRGEPIDGGAQFESRVIWLRAHHDGHIFPPRRSLGRALVQNARGRFVSASKLKRVKLVFDIAPRAHIVGVRVLPARNIYPTRGMPTRWADAINRGSRAALIAWRERAQGG